ncbi:MAG: CRISPR-associated primase-polymerase type A1 [Thermodesulfobacteriota bacterium]
MSDATLHQVRDLLDAGQTAEAKTLALARSTKDIRDPALHLAWADTLAELEMFDEMLTELNLAARDDPASIRVKKRLAEVYQDFGRVNPAADCWRAALALEPGDPELYLSLGRLLETAGNLEAAAEVYTDGLNKTGQAAFKAMLKELKPQPEPAETREEPGQDLAPRETDLVRFCHLFEGREGVYARQWVGANGKSGYTPVKEPLTPAVARNHILGNYTVGVYPLRLDNTVKFLAFDLDLPSFDVTRSIGDRRAWDGLMARAHKLALSLIETAQTRGLTMYLEDSGFKGRHCWLFFRDPVPGVAARRFAVSVLERLDLSQPGVHVEIFPKQAAIRGDGLGNLIKLPLGLHRVSNRRSLFVDQDGRPIPDQLGFLQAIEPVERELFLEIVKRTPPPQPARLPSSSPGAEGEAAPGERPDRPAAGPAAIEEYDPERDPELQYLLLKCEVVRAIVEGLNREGRIEHEETLVLAHTVGYLKNGPDAFNSLLRRAVNVEPSQFLQSRLKGNPISCPKIRKRLNHVTARVHCDCRFEPGLNLYPSPVRHVQTMSVEAAASGAALDSMRFEQLFREYMKVKRQLAEMSALLLEYEKRLAGVFEESGAEQVRTSQGVLRMVKEADGRPAFTLTM